MMHDAEAQRTDVPTLSEDEVSYRTIFFLGSAQLACQQTHSSFFPLEPRPELLLHPLVPLLVRTDSSSATMTFAFSPARQVVLVSRTRKCQGDVFRERKKRGHTSLFVSLG